MSQFKAIPQPSDQRNVSQNDLLTNMAYLNNANGAPASGILPVDHISTGDNIAVPSCGFHKQVSMLNQGSSPPLLNPVGGATADNILYTLSAAGNSQLHFKFGSGNQQDTELNDCRVYCSFDGAGTKVGNSFNVNTITRTAAGRYTINFVNALPNTDYGVFVSIAGSTPRIVIYNNKQIGSVDIRVTASTGNFDDPNFVSVYIIGLY